MNLLKWLFNPEWFTFYMSGSGSAPTSSSVYQSSVPEYARPYVETMLDTTQKQLMTGTGTGANFRPTGFRGYVPSSATFHTFRFAATVRRSPSPSKG